MKSNEAFQTTDRNQPKMFSWKTFCDSFWCFDDGITSQEEVGLLCLSVFRRASSVCAPLNVKTFFFLLWCEKILSTRIYWLWLVVMLTLAACVLPLFSDRLLRGSFARRAPTSNTGTSRWTDWCDRSDQAVRVPSSRRDAALCDLTNLKHLKHFVLDLSQQAKAQVLIIIWTMAGLH